MFPAPDHVAEVRLSSDEVDSMCPVTSQPDLSTVEIAYEPDRWCVETKSLKLYLWGFRERPVFAEALAAEIAGEIMATAQPRRVTVVLTQRPRGGIVVSATAETDPRLTVSDAPRSRSAGARFRRTRSTGAARTDVSATPG